MRLHVTCQGKKTTISIEDQLIDYLGAWLVEKLPRYHNNAEKQLDKAKDYIRRYLAAADGAEVLPAKNLSQHVQAHIIELIAAPYIADILKARGPRHAIAPARQAASAEEIELAMAAVTASFGNRQPAKV